MAMKLKSFLLKTYDDIFTSILFALTIGSLSFIPLKMDSLSSLCHKAMLFVIIVWMVVKVVLSIIYFVNRKKQHLEIEFFTSKNIIFSLCLLSLLFGFISICVTAGGRPFTKILFTKYLLFAEVISVIGLFSTIKISKKPFYILVWLAVFMSVLLFVLWISGYANAHEGYSTWKLLTLNYSNANLAGLVTFALIMILLFGFFFFKNWILKIGTIGCIVAIGFLHYLTSARASLIAFAIAIFVFFFWFIFRKKNPNLIFSFLVPLLPMIFAIAYFIFYALYLPNGAYAESYDIVLFGKYLGSRYIAWRDAFWSISNVKNFLFGTYYDGCVTAGAFHHHNGILDLFATYGFIPFIFIISFVTLSIYYSLKKNKGLIFSSLIGIIFIFFTFFLGFSESGPFYSSNGIYALWFASILMIRFPRGASEIENVLGRPLKKKEKGGILIISNVYGIGSIGKLVQSSHLNNLKNGIKSYVIYGRGEKVNDPYVVTIEDFWAVAWAKFRRKFSDKQWVGTNLMTFDIIDAIKNIKPGVVHIHAVNDDFVNYKLLFNYLSWCGIKTVYTNHSEWMYLGACGGHAYSCTKYINERCFNCPKKVSNAGLTFKVKNKVISSFAIDNLIITSVSPWLNERSSNSEIFKNFKNQVVLDANDIGEVKPSFSTKEKFINKYVGNNSYSKIVLFVTPSLNNPLKGFRYVIELANKNTNYIFLVVSLKNDWKENNIPNNMKIITEVITKEELASFYTYSDITLLTSEQETFSMPVAESLSCGTPVCGFKAGGPESIALGYGCSTFVDYGDIDALNEALNNMLKKKYIKDNIKKDAIKKYSVDTMAKEYRKIYEELNPKYNDSPYEIKEKPLLTK